MLEFILCIGPPGGGQGAPGPQGPKGPRGKYKFLI